MGGGRRRGRPGGAAGGGGAVHHREREFTGDQESSDSEWEPWDRVRKAISGSSESEWGRSDGKSCLMFDRVLMFESE